MRRRRRRWRNRIGIAVRPFDAFASSRSDGPPVAGAFKPRIMRRSEPVAERRLPIDRGGQAWLRDARLCLRQPGLESPGYRQGIAPRCAALDFGEERELAQLRRLWRASSWKSSACWRRALPGKFEIRISKSETNSKSVKAGNGEGCAASVFRHFQPFGFVSDCPMLRRRLASLGFGFRYSDFPSRGRSRNSRARRCRAWGSCRDNASAC